MVHYPSMIRKIRVWLLLSIQLSLLAGCGEIWNSPYPDSDSGQGTIYSVFEERPKHLDPARSYSSNEVQFTGQIYEPLLQYHFLKRPYTLEPLTITGMPVVRYWGKSGREVPEGTPAVLIARTTYDVELKHGILYQPHPAFARLPNGKPRYFKLDEAALAHIDTLSDFAETGTRELTADDYVYEIKRLASPQLNSPIFGLMSEYILGLDDLNKRLVEAEKKQPNGTWLDLRPFDLEGARATGKYSLRITLKTFYPQFSYWLAMPFFAPVPWEAERFYTQRGMDTRNLNIDWFPVGTGPFMLSENDPNRRMVLSRNPNFHGERYPAEGMPEDRENGMLRDAGTPLPIINRAVFTLEKEAIPQWTKFLQGYYDMSGISSDNFDQAIHFTPDGEANLTPEMKQKGIRLVTAVATSDYYMGFNMKDPLIGQPGGESARKLRQAISIAVDYDELVSIFLNGRGIAAQGVLPPGIFGYKDDFNPVVYSAPGKRRSLDEAKALLAQAGYPNGRSASTGQPLVLYYDTAAAGPDSKPRLDWLIKQFRKIDIQLVIRATDYNRFQDKMSQGNAQIFEWGWNADYPDPENFFFLLYGPNAKVGKGGENASNYSNPEFDRFYAQMKDMANGPQRQQIIDRMTDILRQDAPWLFGFHPKEFTLRHAWVGNIKPNLMANNTLKYRRVDAALRQHSEREWNRPVLWPFAVMLLLLAGLVWPAWSQYRKREAGRA